MRRIKKNIYVGAFATTIAVLGIAKLIVHPVINPQKAEEEMVEETVDTIATMDKAVVKDSDSLEKKETIAKVTPKKEEKPKVEEKPVVAKSPRGVVSMGRTPHRILSVHSYKDCFPDIQDVQIVSARKWGVKPVRNREQAEKRKNELVYISANPYYKIDTRMKSSIPYLVPRAADLLQMIARNYLDSLYVKGVPMHKLIVTSVLRTEEDVAKLRKHNGNATQHSCHRYGTTFDICYNRYETVSPPGEHRRTVQNDTLKWVLSEVLRDIHDQGLCHVKYEVKQGCFHITVK